MDIAPETRVIDLIEESPHLLDVLVGLSPEFRRLRNPFLRKTLGRRATLRHAARMSGLPLERIIDELKRAVAGGPPEDSSADRARRIETLKGIIRDLHAGRPVEEQKARFAELLESVSPGEIAEMEQALMKEGMAPEEVKRLCDVHVQVMEASFQNARSALLHLDPGHPVDVFLRENRAMEKLLKEIEGHFTALRDGKDVDPGTVRELLGRIGEIELHFLRKENQLFPVLERHEISGPSKVMWALHDDIRDLYRHVSGALESGAAEGVAVDGLMLVGMIRDMIYKEENILFPMSLETLTAAEWGAVAAGGEEIGYALIGKPPRWREPSVEPAPKRADALVGLREGALSPEQIDLLLRHLPLDVTFVDENDRVRYYSAGAERIFPRSPGIIGRDVKNCHPPASVHVVERILDAFKKGEKDTAEFWIPMGPRFIHIRYFAMRDEEGGYRGTLEVSQDVTAIRGLEGERRLLDW